MTVTVPTGGRVRVGRRLGATSTVYDTAAPPFGHTPAPGNIVSTMFITSAATAPTAPTGWVLDGSFTGLSSYHIYVYSHQFDGTESGAYTWSFASSTIWQYWLEGHSDQAGATWQASALVATSNAGSVTSWPMGATGVLPKPNNLFIAGLGLSNLISGTAAIANGGTWTVLAGNSEGNIFGDTTTSATTSFNPTASWSSAVAVDAAGYLYYSEVTPVTTTPSAVPLVLALPAPTVSADGSASPSAVAMAMAYPAPTITASGQPAPSPVPMVMGFPLPDVVAGTPVNAASLAMSLLYPTPGIRADQTAFATAVPMAMAFPAPTILITVPVFPTPVEMAFGFPRPDVEARFGPTPVFALGRAPSTSPADRYPEPPYNPARAVAPVQYRDGGVPYDPTP